jgi:hypothetical protein
VNRDVNRDALARTLQAGSDCLPLERLGAPLEFADRAHLDGCPRCQAELALLEAADTESPDERADIQWVTHQLRSRGATRRAPSPARVGTPWLSVSRLLPIAAALALAVLVGYSMWDPEPTLVPMNGAQQVYRTGGIDGLKPTGDLDAVPITFEWSPVGGAIAYDVKVSEVDGTELWHGSSATPHIDPPASLQARFIPGKTILWQVTARNTSGAALADSGPQRFRLRISRR